MKKGFTLIELLLVIAIIGVLALLISVSLQHARSNADIARARATIHEIRKAMAGLENDVEEWPGHMRIDNIGSGVSGNEVWDLSVPSVGISQTDGNFRSWNGPYMAIVPLDPWGNNYFFDPDYDVDLSAGARWAAVIGSFGPNGIGQNVYDSDNIIDILSTR